MRAQADDSIPTDPTVLQAMVASLRGEVVHHKAHIAKLQFELARLKRQKFGRSSEQLSAQIEQLELLLGALGRPSTGSAVSKPQSVPADKPAKAPRTPLTGHLPREVIEWLPSCSCPDCGGTMRKIGEDVSEMLERVPERFKVIRHIRPKLACTRCERIVQEAAPSRPIARGLAGPGLLAHVLVSKYADHLPLYRQQVIYARSGVELERSTLADWVGSTARLLDPLVQALGRHVLTGHKLHADDTPVPVLQPGRGKTKTGRLWTYVRDDRPAGDTTPPAVLFRYSPDRKGERAADHLATFRGVLQADGYAGFERLYEGGIVEAACWAHVRRKFHDLYVAHHSPIAAEALVRIGELYKIERDVRYRVPAARELARQARAGPLLAELQDWLHQRLSTLSGKSALSLAIRYALTRWQALTRYRDDGRIEIGRVEMWRGGRRSGLSVGRPFRLAVPEYPRRSSVSTSPSSNRTCRSPASGSLATHQTFAFERLRLIGSRQTSPNFS